MRSGASQARGRGRSARPSRCWRTPKMVMPATRWMVMKDRARICENKPGRRKVVASGRIGVGGRWLAEIPLPRLRHDGRACRRAVKVGPWARASRAADAALLTAGRSRAVLRRGRGRGSLSPIRSGERVLVEGVAVSPPHRTDGGCQEARGDQPGRAGDQGGGVVSCSMISAISALASCTVSAKVSGPSWRP